jgi:mercuric ion transport protein
MALGPRIADKAGFLGAFISAMGCAVCFPALASFGTAIGLGFLTRWESLFITTLIPVFALLALAANVLGWRIHRQTQRLVLGVIGPLLVLSAVLLMRFAHVRTASLLYVGLAFMLAVSVWDLVSPPARRSSHSQEPRCSPEV